MSASGVTLRSVSVLILFCCVIALAQAEQYYPEQLHVVSSTKTKSKTYFGSTTGIYLSANQTGSLATLTSTHSNAVTSITIPCDRVEWISYSLSNWFVITTLDNVVHCTLYDVSLKQVADTTIQLEGVEKIKVLSTTPNEILIQNKNTLLECSLQQHRINVTAIATIVGISVTSAYHINKEWYVCTQLQSQSFEISKVVSTTMIPVGIIKSQPTTITTSQDYILYLQNENGKYVLKQLSTDGTTKVLATGYDGFYEPLSIVAQHDTITTIFKNGIVRTVKDEVICSQPLDLSSFQDDIATYKYNSVIVVSDDDEYSTLTIQNDGYWQAKRILNSIQVYAFSIIGLLIVLFLLMKYFYYRNIIRSVLENNNGTITFVLDRNMKLRRINNKGRELFKMDTSTPLRRGLRYYCNQEYHKIIESFVLNAFNVRNSVQQKLVLKDDTAEREMVFTAQPIQSVTGGFSGVVVSATDITEELEKKRLVNWAQLAHDMQTNLSIIKLNAEQISIAGDERGFEKKHRIIFQAGLLLQRVRDIISIGRDERLHPDEVEITALFQDIIKEFDDDQFSHVTFSILTTPLLVKMDKTKMFRAIRNAVENGIRALKGENGSVKLSCTKSNKQITISVSDTGVGMDANTKENFLKPYFSNYRQYGGTGIGTMIMVRAIEIHGGTIVVDSEVGKGTTIQFVFTEK